MNNSGNEAEKMAATYLQQHGLILLETNYRCRFGEIDLVMRDGNATVFVEVRLRSNTDFGGAGISITPAQTTKTGARCRALSFEPQQHLVPL